MIMMIMDVIKCDDVHVPAPMVIQELCSLIFPTIEAIQFSKFQNSSREILQPEASQIQVSGSVKIMQPVGL